MKKTENRAVVVKYCDFCGKESKSLSKCAVCKKEMCSEGGGKTHAAYSVEIYRYSDAQRIVSTRVCKKCSVGTFDLSIGAFFDEMMRHTPVLLAR